MRMIDMAGLCRWMADTRVSITIKDETWIIPAVQSVHILAIAVVLASIAMLNLRLAGLTGREQSIQKAARQFFPWAWRALPVLLATGIIMILGEPSRELLNRFFWIKMSLVIVVVLLTIPMRHLLEDRPFRTLPATRRGTLRALALISLVLWLSIIFCGRWIAYA
jgi:uncharacterized membrane protein